ncbi:MAG: hypothetical protein HY650_12475 [Acidobacteria bacterium]|nr:hypothetical protein [Acidobacteriota bacterium]
MNRPATRAELSASSPIAPGNRRTRTVQEDRIGSEVRTHYPADPAPGIEITRMCRGKAYFTTPHTLGKYILFDYMNRKVRNVH